MFEKIILSRLILEESNINGLGPSPLGSLLLLFSCFSFNELLWQGFQPSHVDDVIRKLGPTLPKVY